MRHVTQHYVMEDQYVDDNLCSGTNTSCYAKKDGSVHMYIYFGSTNKFYSRVHPQLVLVFFRSVLLFFVMQL